MSAKLRIIFLYGKYYYMFFLKLHFLHEKIFTKQRDSSMFWIFMHIHHYAHYKK